MSRVDVMVDATRWLIFTGADFDIETMQRAHHGTLWFGSEFGSFLMHTDVNGKVFAPVVKPHVDSDEMCTGGGSLSFTLGRSFLDILWLFPYKWLTV